MYILVPSQASFSISPCYYGQFRCGNGQCIDRSRVCDGRHRDCRDGSDEWHCSSSGELKKILNYFCYILDFPNDNYMLRQIGPTKSIALQMTKSKAQRKGQNLLRMRQIGCRVYAKIYHSSYIFSRFLR